MDRKGAQTEPKNQQIEPQGAAKSEKPTKLPSKGGTMEPQVLQWSPKTPQSTRKTRKRSSKYEQSTNMYRKCRKHTQAHINHKPKQATNQGNKERRESAHKRTNKQTPTYTFTQINSLPTTRPLESSFELQTQTQTPAAGCSPKAT